MQAPRKTTKVQQYVIRRPFTSEMGPHKLGAMPWKMRYEVTVKLTSSMETLRSLAIAGRAGKYTFDAKPETFCFIHLSDPKHTRQPRLDRIHHLHVAATEIIRTIRAFCRLSKMLYGCSAASGGGEVAAEVPSAKGG